MKIIRKGLTKRLQLILTEMYLKDRLIFYYHFFSNVNFYEFESPEMPTMAATLIDMRLAILYTPEYLDSHTDDEIKFTLIHEMAHLCNSHLGRGVGYDPKMSNIAMDMVINNMIEVSHGFKAPDYDRKVTIPTMTAERAAKFKAEALEDIAKIEAFGREGGITVNEEKLAERRKRIDKIAARVGQPEIVTLDPNYKGDLVFEPLYAWLKENHQKHQDGEPNELSDETKELLDNHCKNGQSFDLHIQLDEVSQEIKDQLVQETVERAKVNCAKDRGTISDSLADMLKTLLQPPPKNNLKLLKRIISTLKGFANEKAWKRPNRKVPGVKGKIKVSSEINAILDTSGSMGGEFEIVLRELFVSGYVINMVQCDTHVYPVQRIKSRNELKVLPIHGLGGTILQPAMDFVMDPKNKLTKFPTIVLTDGCTDAWDFHGSPQQFLIVTTGSLVDVSNAPNVQQLKIER